MLLGKRQRVPRVVAVRLHDHFENLCCVPMCSGSRQRRCWPPKHGELRAVEFNALFTFRCNWQLEHADFKPLVPNTKTVNVPIQNLDAVALTIEEQEQMPRQGVLVKRATPINRSNLRFMWIGEVQTKIRKSYKAVINLAFVSPGDLSPLG